MRRGNVVLSGHSDGVLGLGKRKDTPASALQSIGAGPLDAKELGTGAWKHVDRLPCLIVQICVLNYLSILVFCSFR